ncbi:MAG: hypothetical protein JW810_06120, partial [Sedimentisphaerales bacterium]|nr:hypothetical protein [Sedimentisphaerales bacterium]
EVESFRKQDPILILQDRMTRAGLLSPEQAKQMDDAGKKAAEEAIRFAEQSEPPALETLWEDVLAEADADIV